MGESGSQSIKSLTGVTDWTASPGASLAAGCMALVTCNPLNKAQLWYNSLFFTEEKTESGGLSADPKAVQAVRPELKTRVPAVWQAYQVQNHWDRSWPTVVSGCSFQPFSKCAGLTDALLQRKRGWQGRQWGQAEWLSTLQKLGRGALDCVLVCGLCVCVCVVDSDCLSL